MVYLIKCSLCECNYIVIPHRDFLISVWCVCLESVCHWECSWCAVLKRRWPTAWLVFILDSLPSEDGAFCPAQAQYWYLLEKTIHQGTGEALKGYCQVPVFGFSKTGLSFFFFFLNPLEASNWTEMLGNTLSLSVCFSSSVQKAFPSALPPLVSITNPAKEPASFLGSSVLPFQWLHKPGYGLLTDLGLSYSLKTHWSPCCVLGTIAYLPQGVQR